MVKIDSCGSCYFSNTERPLVGGAAGNGTCERDDRINPGNLDTALTPLDNFKLLTQNHDPKLRQLGIVKIEEYISKGNCFHRRMTR